MKVLITGASGFVGQAIVAELAARGHETVTVGGPRSRNCDHSIDISDAPIVDALSEKKGVDAVVHAAGIAHRFGGVSAEEFQRVNVQGVENVASLAVKLGAKHFVLFSSTLVYGRRAEGGVITENDEGRPFDSYGQSKLDGEAAARAICEPAGIALTIFRPAPIIGEGSKGNFARLIKAIDRRRFVWVGNGDNWKSVVFIGDVAAATADVNEKGGNGTQTFNLAGDAVRMKDIVDTIAEKLGRRAPNIHLPAGPLRAVLTLGPFDRLSATLETWLSEDVYSNARLQDAYGFKPSTSLGTAIGSEVEYYLKHK